MNAVVFLHGAGRAGPAAWPKQAQVAPQGWLFIDRHESGDDPFRDADRILELLGRSGGGSVAAASYGGNAAVLAAQRAPELVRSLVLFEPGCFDLARGRPAVEEHVAAMSSVYAAADDPAVSAREFARRFAAGMGTPVPELPEEVLEREVSKLRALRTPWNIGLEPSLPVPTVVVTGGWSPLYDEVAEALVDLGARHEVLAGHGHRPQDADGANDLL